MTGEFLALVVGKWVPPENGSGNYIQSPQAGLFVQDGSGGANAICFVSVVPVMFRGSSENIQRLMSAPADLRDGTPALYL